MATQTGCPTSGARATRVRGYAWFWILAFCFLGISFIALGLLSIPWKANQRQTIKLLPATEGQLSENTQPIYVSRDRFLMLAKGEQVIMAIQGTSVVYEVVLKNTSFLYTQDEPMGRYSAVGEYEIRDGVLIRTLIRDKFSVLAGALFAAVGILSVLLGKAILKERVST